MRMIRFISAICLCAAMAISCMADMDFSFDDLGKPKIIGKVTDPDDKPIEHIKVTIDWNEGEHVVVKYTDSDGLFSTYMHSAEEGESQILTITLEDIDGDEFGGTFSTKSETMTLLEENNSTINLVYRLNHAIALENSPQF
ncbi:MAG: hypothetical protein IJN26_07835 [Bacteroidales bacterium]|nr:hypothetical protein [Bacteroidales bacterium]